MLPANVPRAHAPGKIILSGEHSVVFGAPVLSVSIAQYTQVWLKPIHGSGGLFTAFEQVSRGEFYPFATLSSFKQTLDHRFEQFVGGKLPVQNILQRPDDLVMYAVASFIQQLPVPEVADDHPLPVPGTLGSCSSLPLGAGMGSSAAVIAATFALYENLFNETMTPEERIERIRFCERLRHGRGSAIDAVSVVYGGVNRVEGNQFSRPNIPTHHALWTGEGWYWVLHGTPASATGECVAAVRRLYEKDVALWQEFSDCTNALQTNLEANVNPITTLRHNHRLLVRIGVVPTATQDFVNAVERAGGAAKVCGAGSIKGDQGGVVLVYIEDKDAMNVLMADKGNLRWAPLKVSPSGAVQGAAP
ncbi:ghmp kinase family protein [Rhodobacteraceae bacterium KLH11]|nr:ghmp kinase family protein [Rhodobacteraceae bacterium KLH11]